MSKGIKVSDHAILRLLERRYGQEDVIKKVIKAIKVELKGAPHNCKIRIESNLEAVIQDGVLVTVKPI